MTLRSTLFVSLFLILGFGSSLSRGEVSQDGQDMLRNLGQLQDFVSKRVSSFDRTGGNNDRLSIPKGETITLAEIEGPAAIHHIWVTIAAEAFYGRKLVLRVYWDGESFPSVETPIGDFFGVGHGLNRNLNSLAINCSSEGRARNCYWYMPFRSSARLTVTNEGQGPVGAFYYYIDYRELESLPPETPTFHAQYLQEMPCREGQNYLLLQAEGRGHYVGCNLSILQRGMGWWGEGDDMIYVDGEDFPSLYGTGSEDYFSDAWGMREAQGLFYGCPLQEPDFKTGSKATVYRHHIPDPIPFQESLQVTIEHGHANDRSDFFSSVAYWYQVEPHTPFPKMASVQERLPFALETPGDLTLPDWQERTGAARSLFEDMETGMTFRAGKAVHNLTSYYNQRGRRYPVLTTDASRPGDIVEVDIKAEFGEQYNLEFFYLTGPAMGDIRILEPANDSPGVVISGYSKKREIKSIPLPDVYLARGKNTLRLRVEGSPPQAQGTELGFVGLNLTPSQRRFITSWNLIGPFDAPDMSYLQTVYPPEREIALAKTYPGKKGVDIGWRQIQIDRSGFVRLQELMKPNEQSVAYGLTYIHAPETIDTYLLLGSDDGVRVWLNGALIHTNPAYRGAYPDQDKLAVHLKRGWNTFLIKVLQGAGGNGFYVRFIDPENKLRFTAEKDEEGRMGAGTSRKEYP
jgi:hypothetical protein